MISYTFIVYLSYLLGKNQAVTDLLQEYLGPIPQHYSKLHFPKALGGGLQDPCD